MAGPPDTRDDLRRALVVNALTKPLNLLVPALVVVTASLLGAGWLAAVALLCWLALALVTFLDEEEARRVGHLRRVAARAPAAGPAVDPGTLAPPIERRLRAALAAAEAVRAAVCESALPLADVTTEVEELVGLIERRAVRADRMHRFLAERPPPAAALEPGRQPLARLERLHAELLAEMDRAVSALGMVHAEVLAADGLAERGARRMLIDQVVELQGRVRLVSDGLEEAFEDTRGVHRGTSR